MAFRHRAGTGLRAALRRRAGCAYGLSSDRAGPDDGRADPQGSGSPPAAPQREAAAHRAQCAQGSEPVSAVADRSARFDIVRDADADLIRAGYMSAAMGLPLDPDAPEPFVRGHFNYRPEDGHPAGLEQERSEVVRRLYADGMLPERRRGVESQAHRLAGWESAMWLIVAFVAGLAWPGIIAGLRAVFGGAA